MRNLQLVDAVIALHDIARLVMAETADQNLHDDLRNCAERLHRLSIADGAASRATGEIIKQAQK